MPTDSLLVVVCVAKQHTDAKLDGFEGFRADGFTRPTLVQS